MSGGVDPATAKAQADASDPRASAWVSANAGSGKTHVLAQRVVRLLLAGTEPGRILCLTFTRAAAAEMANRVFARLGEWTALSDAALSRAIAELEGRRPDKATLARARRLFAQALDTPGGLKIQTIHAFCERLLHQFPFEANVPGHFEVLDERDATELADAARRAMIARAAADRDGPLGRALAAALAAATDFVLDLAVKEFVDKRDRVLAWLRQHASLDAALRDLKADLGLAPGETAASLRAEIVGGCPIDLARLHQRLAASPRDGDVAAAGRLAPAVTASDTGIRAEGYLDFWMTAGDELRKVSSLVSRAVKDLWPGLTGQLDGERERLAALLDRIAAADCHESTAAVLRLAEATIAEYERLKAARGVLDFNDLIVRTAALLSRSDASRWVLYKLDRGLDHILVDEAQDTSPRQWQVVAALAEEMFAGEGASDALRTLFAVGDEKQSIFSFQGAVPAWFSRMRRELGGRARGAGRTWHDPELHLSFRSVPAILAAVDAVFADEAAWRGLAGEPGAPTHAAHRRDQPGRVIVWPMLLQPEKIDPPDWTTPLDHLGEKSPEVRLANRIAETIRTWLNRGEVIEATGKPIRPQDILVLTRTRGAQTDAINRALKTKGIPIAGADRLTLNEHIAVMDLLALGRVMLLPEDDLSLAAVLKSPLIGLTEDQLFAIAHGRGPLTLWASLGEAAVTGEGAFKAARDRLDRWRSEADFRDPHAFYARVLGADRGREMFLRRLGSEAEDVLDEFLAQALAYEQAHVPSLEGFLAWLEAAETQIRRDTDSLREEVRVMTVHGAKGLEAGIVFLVDNGMQPVHANHDPRVLALADDRDGTPTPLVWMRMLKAMPEVVKARVDTLREEAREEYRRLLYVAMTRARDRLYICGTDRQISDREKPFRWHEMIRAALEPECRPEVDADGTLVALEWRAEEAREVAPKGRQEAMSFAPQKPEWMTRPPPPAPPRRRRITPSTAASDGEETPPPFVPRFAGDASAEAAIERGRLIHRLLESLPDIAADRRAATGRQYLDVFAHAWTEEDRAALLAEVLAVLADPGFAPVFAPGSRAEVEIAGRVGGSDIAGRIDRLAVTAERVLIVDYKTNRPAPASLAEVPRDYAVQLALYRLVLRRLYPGRAVSAAILWTDSPALMEVPAADLDAAEAAVIRGSMPMAPGSPAAGDPLPP